MWVLIVKFLVSNWSPTTRLISNSLSLTSYGFLCTSLAIGWTPASSFKIWLIHMAPATPPISQYEPHSSRIIKNDSTLIYQTPAPEIPFYWRKKKQLFIEKTDSDFITFSNFWPFFQSITIHTPTHTNIYIQRTNYVYRDIHKHIYSHIYT